MSRKYAKCKSRIKRMCAINDVREKELYEKGKLLLEIYRDVCWTTETSADYVREDLMEYEVDYCSRSMDEAFVYLENFAPETSREKLEDKIREHFEVKWMVDIIEAAMVKVRAFPVYGEMYYDILHIYYLGTFDYTESEALEMLKMERSTFYRRKKEAIILFSLSIWGAPMDEFKKFMIINGQPQQISIFEEL